MTVTGSGPVDRLWAVVPAGGAGTRLWPLSRAAEPKFLRDLTGSGRSLLQSTCDRLAPLVTDRVLVVTGRAHADAVRAQLPELPADAVVAEPSARDSMAAIGLAAALLERRDPDAVMGSFAADHVITGADLFTAAVRTAVTAARDDWLVTVGIAPTFPSAGFGYIHVGDPLAGHAGVHAVREFVEKPSVSVAEGYLASGEHRWNASMFVVRPTVLLDLLAERHPEFAAALRGIAAAPDTLDEVWPTLPRIALDHAVAEPAAAAGRVAVVPARLRVGRHRRLRLPRHPARGPHHRHRDRPRRPGPGRGRRRHRPGRARLRPRGRGGRPRRRRRRRHPRRRPRHQPRPRAGGQAGRGRPAGPGAWRT